MTRVAFCLNILILLAGAACNNYTAPAGTSKPVTPLQLAGTWAVQTVEGPKGTLALVADGTCSFSPTVSGSSVTGTWTLDRNAIAISLPATTFSGWVIDSSSGKSGFAIYGGDDDPDLYAVWY